MKENPRDHANLWSLLTFRWLSPLVQLGNKVPLKQTDLPLLSTADKTEHLTLKLELNWLKEDERARKKLTKPSLWRALLGITSVKEILFLLIMFWIGCLSIVSTPLLLYWLLSALTEGGSEDALIFAVSISVMSFVRSIVWCHGLNRSSLLGMRVRTAITGLIYKKVLNCSEEDLSAITTGHVMNLISNDLNRFDRVMLFLPRCLSAPLEVIGLSVVVYYIAGWPALVGVTVTLVLVICQVGGSRTSAGIRRKAARITDRRITLVREIINGIRTVKMHGWEQPCTDTVLQTRRAEVQKYRQMYTIEALFSFFENATLATFAFIMVVIFTFGDSVASVPIIFSVMASFASIRVSAQRILGYGLKKFQDCCVSERRIAHFFQSSDASYERNRPRLSCLRKETVSSSQKKGDSFIEIQGLTVSFHKDRPILQDISLLCSNNEMVGLTGVVGSGKTTLLSAILGQVSCSKGKILSIGRIAYVPQVPWIFNGNVQENIIFGLPFDAGRYQDVVRACDLASDFEAFTNGDMSVIGERGAALSGGQRARVSLARAVYADSNIYLIDDTLSALDVRVGKHVYANCINGLLKDKLRILVTHQYQYLEGADRVFVLGDGTIRESSYKDIMAETSGDDAAADGNRDGEQVYKSPDREERLFDAGSSKGLLQHEEERNVGKVSWRTYLRYLKAGMAVPILIALCVFVVMTPVLDSVPGLLMSKWTHESWAHTPDRPSIVVFICVSIAGMTCRFLQPFLIYQAMMTCNSALHTKMLNSIVKSPVIFFDRNPVGRILNRFSADIGYLDDIFPYALGVSVLVIDALLALAIPAFANAWLLLGSLPPLGFYIWYSKRYLPVSREVTRLQSLARTPVYAHYSSSMEGLATINVHQAQETFIKNLYSNQDSLAQAWFVYISTSRWLTFRFYIISSSFMAIVCISSVLLDATPGVTGFAIAYAIKMLGKTDFLVRNIAETENQMTSAQRIMNYTELPVEPAYDSDRHPPENWPNQGVVEFSSVSLQYYEGGPRVLRDVSFRIGGQEKIGIAGRTGAGKSSMVSCLMRMPQATGDVIIDGVNIHALNLQMTRHPISVIQQNPIMFCRSIRRNLDPFGVFTDDEIWKALHDAQVGEFVADLSGKLEYEVKEGGSNFSAGQRQLFCIARALLHQNKIIIMDEATANVDQATDKLIQNTIREKFKECTVLVIAHRLSTIMECDRIMVVHDGKVVEFDTPERLADDSNSSLTRLLQHTQQ